MLKIAFNAHCVSHPVSGIGNVALNIIKILEKDKDVDLRIFYQGKWTNSLESTSSITNTPIAKLMYFLRENKPSLLKNIKKIAPYRSHFAKIVEKEIYSPFKDGWQPNIFIEPNYFGYDYSNPTVVIAHDLSHIRCPETHPQDRIDLMNHHFPKAIEKSAAIIAISQFTKNEILENFDISAEKIFLGCNGADENFKCRNATEVAATLEKFNLSYRKFFLSVGTLEPRKNLHRVIAAYQTLPDNIRNEFPLIICGAKGWGETILEANIKQLIDSNQLRILNYVSQTDLYNLFSSARSVCYVSIYEGFGLPVLEAMQSGTPIITSNISSMPEVVGKAGLKVNPYEITEIAEALQNIAVNDKLFQEQIVLGLSESKRYSWQKCANIIKEIARSY